MKSFLYHMYSILGNFLWLLSILILWRNYGRNSTTNTIAIFIFISIFIEGTKNDIKKMLEDKK